jgi:hypothetical protein
VAVEFEEQPGEAINAVIFGNGKEELALRRIQGSTCVEGSARLNDREASRIASLGEQNLAALIGEELRVRSHDAAFEKAVRTVGAGA